MLQFQSYINSCSVIQPLYMWGADHIMNQASGENNFVIRSVSGHMSLSYYKQQSSRAGCGMTILHEK